LSTPAPASPAGSSPSGAEALRRLRWHYLAVYAIFGCVSPYLPVYLGDIKGLSPEQIGLIFAIGQSGVLVLPALMTLMADRYRIVAPIMIALFMVNLTAMAGLSLATGLTACLAAVVLNQFANQPQLALTDGLFFSLQARAGPAAVPFSSVRVWGTIGFIGPSLALFSVYSWGGLTLVPYAAMLMAVAGLVNARHLPRRLPDTGPRATRLPTAEAARLLLQPRTALFCAGLGCVIAANAGYYAFYPVYLTREVGVDPRWIGLIANVGVVIEIAYMLGFERLQARFGLAGVTLAGIGAVLIRNVCLAFFPTIAAAVGLQAVHGLAIVGVHLAPLMILNRLVTGESYRNSVQGLYAMLVVGVFGITGNFTAGQLAGRGLPLLYQVNLATTAVGFALVLVALRWRDSDGATLGGGRPA
jgi:PPP family 3-phenylpropionic acid transporter